MAGNPCGFLNHPLTSEGNVEITLTITESGLDSLALGAVLIVLFLAAAWVMITQAQRTGKA